MAETGNILREYTYDSFGNMTQFKLTVSGAVKSTTAYAYDANGNTLTATTGTDVVTYTYNNKNQQISWSDGTNTVTYTYNLSSLRATKTNVGVGITINYVWSGGNMVYEYVTGFATTGIRHYYGLTLFHSSNGNFYLYNGHGDVVQLVDQNRNILHFYEYDAFGNEKEPDASDTNYFRYVGQYYDFESGTYYLRARYYNPANGRFTQQDAWGYENFNDPLSLNLYCYCSCNPVMYIDPSGNKDIFNDHHGNMYTDRGTGGQADTATEKKTESNTPKDQQKWYDISNITDAFWDSVELDIGFGIGFGGSVEIEEVEVTLLIRIKSRKRRQAARR